jgi:hypothetical protein
LDWDTVEGDAGDYTATVASDDDTATASVTVESFASGDGSQAFLGNSLGNSEQFAATTNFDISTLTADGSDGPTMRGFAWDNKGETLVVGDFDLIEYSLSTAFDLGTASQVTSQTMDNAEGVEFNATGGVMIVLDTGAGKIKQYSLDTAFSISSITLEHTFSVNSATHSLAFNDSGDKMYYGQDDGNVYEVRLTNPFDISSVDSTASQALTGGYMSGLAWKPDGSTLYMQDRDEAKIFSYNAEAPFDVTTLTTPADKTKDTASDFRNGFEWDVPPQY